MTAKIHNVHEYNNISIYLWSYCNAETSRSNIGPFQRHIPTIPTQRMMSCLCLVRCLLQGVHMFVSCFCSPRSLSGVLYTDPQTNKVGMFLVR